MPQLVDTPTYNKYDKTVPIEIKIWAQVVKTPTCWIWTGHTGGRHGRGMISWKGRQTYVTRVLWEMEYGEIPPGMYICHTCDNPRCVRLDHLFMGTPKENEADKVAKGRRDNSKLASRGESNPSAKLTETEVILMREMKEEGYGLTELGKLFGVSKHAAWDIVTRRKWKHVP